MCRSEKTTLEKAHAPPPPIAKAFLYFYQALPVVNVPFTNFNISFTLLSTAFLAAVRFVSQSVLIGSFGWPADGTVTEEAAASCAAIVHSTILCLGLVAAFQTQKYDVVATIKEQNDKKWWPDLADATLQLCTGYMLSDGLCILWVRWNSETSTFELGPDDCLYLVHHVMTSSYMISNRIIGAGYMSAMICMLLGECTNPLQNAWLIAQLALTVDCCNGPSMQQFNDVIIVIFAAAYFAVRAIICVPFHANTTYTLLFSEKGRKNIPLPLAIYWSLMIWGVCLGSESWIRKSYHILADFVTGRTGTEIPQEL